MDPNFVPMTAKRRSTVFLNDHGSITIGEDSAPGIVAAQQWSGTDDVLEELRGVTGGNLKLLIEWQHFKP
ncbi:uncharacterized protein DS421_5g146990 [Arachis hypogaea]|nr:uncharacterized protein DS421_5g146990 [Arachis hypogaea]